MPKGTRDFTALQQRYLDARFDHLEATLAAAVASQEKLAEVAKAAADRALDKAETLARHNQEVSNEFRGQLKDQAETLMGRRESLTRSDATDQKIDQLRGEIADLREYRSAMGGARTQQVDNRDLLRWGVIAAIMIAGVLIALATYLRPLS